MRRYETIVILDPDISEDQRQPVFDRFRDAIAQGNGFLVLLDEWGPRKLAYEIKKKPRGHYTRIDFCGSGAIVDEIERFCRIDDRVLKYLTVKLDEEADVDRLKEEIERAESEKTKADAAKAEAAEKLTPSEDVQTDTEGEAEGAASAAAAAETESGKEE